MTPLRQRMIDDLTVRGLSAHTHRAYLRAVKGLAQYYRRSPDLISDTEAQAYLLYMHRERNLSWRTCNVARHGLRFFFRITLGRPEPHFHLVGAKEPSTLPQLLNNEELLRLFAVATYAKHRAMFMTAYAAGLRATEVGRLRVNDVDSGRMVLRVEQGKGQKDRYVPLSPRLLEQLREYWRREHPDSEWLFPGKPKHRPMTQAGLNCAYQKSKEKAGITKPGGVHVLRHCYATGLLEAGVQLHIIQRLLGHRSIRSTMRYLHISHDATSTTLSPLDLLEVPDTQSTMRA